MHNLWNVGSLSFRYCPTWQHPGGRCNDHMCSSDCRISGTWRAGSSWLLEHLSVVNTWPSWIEEMEGVAHPSAHSGFDGIVAQDQPGTRTHSEYLKRVFCTGDGRAERSRGGLRQQRLGWQEAITKVGCRNKGRTWLSPSSGVTQQKQGLVSQRRQSCHQKCHPKSRWKETPWLLLPFLPLGRPKSVSYADFKGEHHPTPQRAEQGRGSNAR